MQDFVGQTGNARVSDALVSVGKSYVMMDIGGTKIACCLLSLHLIVGMLKVSKKAIYLYNKLLQKGIALPL